MEYFAKVICCFLLTVQAYSFDEQNSKIESRIVGGIEAKAKNFTYQASIRTQEYAHICGGAIIGKNWILTSALCVYKQAPNSIVVIVGSHELRANRQKHDVSSIILHERFNPTTGSNDVGLLQLSQPVKYGTYIKRVKLSKFSLWNNVRCHLSGWGSTKASLPQLSYKLRYLEVRSVPNGQCKQVITQFTVHKEDVCAFSDEESGPCVGDNGGPLVCSGYLYGILSRYVPCALDYPDVYTNVSFHGDWIISKTGKLS